MHLHLAIVPPESALAAVADVVGRADSPKSVMSAPAPPAGRLRLFGRRPTETAAPAVAQLEHVPPARMLLPVASFGNVTVSDAQRLGAALREAASAVAAPTVHLSGGAALEFPGDRSVWVKVRDDSLTLGRIARGAVRTVERLGFFVDRREFRPMIAVATITEATTEEVLQHVLDQLDAFSSEPWTVGHLSLMKRLLDARPPRSEEIERIPLSAAGPLA